jgi:fluoroacetyl-CoA thioesterase
LTDVGGTLPNPVLSTPGMVAMMERAAAICAAEELDGRGFTVGFEICVKHFGAASEGANCTARAVLREVVDGRKFRFDVSVSEHDREIGSGTHERRMPRGAGGDEAGGIPAEPVRRGELLFRAGAIGAAVRTRCQK